MSRARTLANYVSSAIAVNAGGTGAATHTANNVLIGAGTSALTSVAPGADGHVLTSTGSAWNSEAAGGGTILQTVTNEYSTQTAVTSTTYASPTSTGLTCAITPQNAGSKILCQIYLYLMVRVHASATDGACAIRVHDGSSYVYDDGSEGITGFYVCGGSGDPSDEIRCRYPTSFYIDADSTSARTYTVSGFLYPSSNSPTVNAQGGSGKSQMILQEIAQ